MNDVKIRDLVNEYLKGEKVSAFVNESLGGKKEDFVEIIIGLIKKIKDLPDYFETSVSQLLAEQAKRLNMMELVEINNATIEVCSKINIELDYSKNAGQIIGLPYNICFIKRMKNICPKCGNKLTFLEPDSRFLYCRNCDVFYKYNNDLMEETTYPYTNPDYLY